MANKIAGLTIEIGGETSGLNKALADVNKKSKDLQSELREVDRLLKLDPKNTELITQKQKLLAESVENTKSKIDTLKESEKQAQEQFKQGKIGEEQYRALQREVIKTEEELKKVEKAAKDFGGSMTQGLKNAGNDIKDFGVKVKGAGEVFMPVSAGAAGLLTGLIANTEATKEYREEMGKLETAFTTSGHSVEDAEMVYGEFYKLLGETDRSVEAVNHLAKLTSTQEELASWTTIATGVYATFGDSLPIEGLTEAANETAKTGELTGVLADALNWAGISEADFKTKLESTNTEKERSELITETLNGLYGEAAEKYREVNGELLEANENELKLNEATAKLGEIMQPLINDILAPLITKLTEIVDWFVNLDDGTQKTILTIIAVVAAIGPLLIIIGNVITVVGTITAALPVLGAAFAVLTGPIGIVIAAVAGIIAIGVALYKNWDEVKAKAIEFKDNLIATFEQIKSDITEKVNLLIESALTWGKNLVEGFWNGIESLNDWIKKKVQGFAEGIGSTIKDFFGINSPSTLMAEYGMYIDQGLAKGISDNANLPLNALKGVASNMVQNIDGMLSQIAKIDSLSDSERVSRYSSNKKQQDNFYNTNKSEIDAISKKQGVDLGVAQEMYRENLISGVPKYAAGTEYHPGGYAWVGELGRELVKLPRGSKVYSNQQSENMLNPSRAVNLSLNVGTLIADDYGLKQLERKLRNIRIDENYRLGVTG